MTAETAMELRQRRYGLLQELRVVLPAVQVLLTFLATVPFAARSSSSTVRGGGRSGTPSRLFEACSFADGADPSGRLTSCDEGRTLAGVQQVLVVANKTADSAELSAAIEARMKQGAVHFVLLVPPVPRQRRLPRFGDAAAQIPAELSDPSENFDYPAAERQLAAALERLRGLGASIDGVVGDPDPLTAIGALVARRQFDEVIISTLPRALSRWLHLDLPSRVERKFNLPVHSVTPGGEDVST